VSSFENQPSLSSLNSNQLSVAKNFNQSRFSSNSIWTTQSHLREKCFPIMPPDESGNDSSKNVNEKPFKLDSKLFEQNPSSMSLICSNLDAVSLMDKEMLQQNLTLLSNRISLNPESTTIKSDSTLSLPLTRSSSSSLVIRLTQWSSSDTSSCRGSIRTPQNSPIDHEKFFKLNSKTNLSNTLSDESYRAQSNQKCLELVTDSDAQQSLSNVASYDRKFSPIYLPKDKFIKISRSNTLFSPSMISSDNSASNSFMVCNKICLIKE